VSIVFLATLFFSSHVGAEERGARIYGNFIQPWLCVTWSDDQWNHEFETMKSLGIEAVILGYSASHQLGSPLWETYYPSRLPDTLMVANVLESLFHHAKNHGFKVYVGSEIHHDWWNWNLATQRDAKKFLDAMTLSAAFLREIYEIYHPRYPEVFVGFFCTFEIWNHADWNQKELREFHADHLSQGFNALIEALDTVAPDLPLLFSPFSTAFGFASLDNTREFYLTFLEKTRFRQQDGMLPMDNIGGGGQMLNTVQDWSKMYAEVIKLSGNKLKVYANVENFVKPHHIGTRGQYPIHNFQDDYIGSMTLGRFIRQIEIAEMHATKIFVFSISHYYSPVNNIEGFHRALLRYFQTGERDDEFPVAPQTVSFGSHNMETPNEMHITWEGASDNNGIARVHLYKDDRLHAMSWAVRRDGGSGITEPTFFCLPNFQDNGADYRLGIIDVWGNETLTPTFKVFQDGGQVEFTRK